MKGNDWLLILCILLVAGALFLLNSQRGLFTEEEKGFARITVDGQERELFSLKEDQSVLIEGMNGHSLVVHIESGEVYVTDATCPDKICMHRGRIRSLGETIVCMPSRIVVEII